MNIDVHTDDPAIHPPRFCNKCYCTLSQQPSPVTPAPLTPSKISLQSVLESPLDKTPTGAEKVAAYHLVRRMMHKSGDILQLPTGGAR